MMSKRSDEKPAKTDHTSESNKAKLIKKSSASSDRRRKVVAVKKKVVARHHTPAKSPVVAPPVVEAAGKPMPAAPRMDPPAMKAGSGDAEREGAAAESVRSSVVTPPPKGEERQTGLEEGKAPPARPNPPAASGPPQIGTILRRGSPSSTSTQRGGGRGTGFSPRGGGYSPRGGSGPGRPPRSPGDRPYPRSDAGSRGRSGGPGRWSPGGGPPRSGPGSFNRGPRPARPGGGFPAGGGGGARPPRGRGGFTPKPSSPPSLPLGGGKSNPRRFSRTGKKETGFNRQSERRKEVEQTFSLKRSSSAPPANPVPKEIHITEGVTVAELARKMNLKGSDLIGKLMRMGMMVTINQQIDAETASLLAQEYGSEVKVVSLYDETVIQADTVAEEHRQNRPPVVTVMGHVDHGKTRLLDAIRSSNVVADEHGGITQHIGAYQVSSSHGLITFLDTPGHEAFSLMRARGASVTDIVVLVVAADDGVMPQTVEALHHARDAKVPILVAVNKMDLPNANVDQVKQQLSQHDLTPEDWGGSTQFIEVSALTKAGIDTLLERISLEAEMLDLRVGFDCRASGRVIESFVDQGRGIVATVVVQEGTLNIGDSFVAGVYSGKVRAMFNEYGDRLKRATPGTPVEIIGFNGCPEAGAPIHAVESERQAKMLEQKRQELQKMERSSGGKKISLDTFYDSINEGQVEELRVIIKGDVHGSVEALQQLLEKLSSDAVKLRCIHAAAGAIVESDVSLAAASKATIIGFHVRPTPRAQALAEKERVEIRKYNIIYDVVDDVRQVMEGMLAPELTEREVATAEVRELFKISRLGTIAGCMVKSGTVARNCSVRVMRGGEKVHEGSISSLKRFKDDVKEVREGFECGISLAGFNELATEDMLHFFVIEKIARKLDGPVSAGSK